MLLKRIAAFLLALLLIFNPMCMQSAYAAEAPATPTDLYEEFEDDYWGEIDRYMFERKVYIDVVKRPHYYGDEVILLAILVDFLPEDNPIYEWQYSFDCENWEVIMNETESTLKFIYTPANENWYYRVVITI